MFIIPISAANAVSIAQFMWQTSWPNSFPKTHRMTRKIGEVTKHSKEKNATQLSKGKTEQQIGEKIKRSAAREQTGDQHIGP